MQTIKIDFDNPGLPQRLDVVENDAQSRFFKAVLYKDGKAYTAPSGATYSIMYRGFGPQNEGWYDTINDGAGKRAACSVSGNVVTCEIARQALRVPGHVSVVLCVTGSNGYMLHGWPIDCNCRNDNYTGGTSVESFFYITQVTNADWTSAIQTWEEIKNTIDPTLSLSGKAADAAKVGEAVGKLKEEIAELKYNQDTEYVITTYKEYNQMAIGTNGDTADITELIGDISWSHLVVLCDAGSIAYVTGEGGEEPRAWALVAKDGSILSAAGTSAKCENVMLDITTDCYVVVNSIVNKEHSLTIISPKKVKSAIENRLATDRFVTADDWVVGAIRTNLGVGSVVNLTVDETGVNYRSQVIDCYAGMHINIKGRGGDYGRLWCFVNRENKIIATSEAYAHDAEVVAEQNGKCIVCAEVDSNTVMSVEYTPYSLAPVLDIACDNKEEIAELKYNQDTEYVITTYKEYNQMAIGTNGDTADITELIGDISWSHLVVLCDAGSIAYVTGEGGEEPRAWALVAKDGSILSAAGTSAKCENVMLDITTDCYVVVNSIVNKEHSLTIISPKKVKSAIENRLATDRFVTADDWVVGAIRTNLGVGSVVNLTVDETGVNYRSQVIDCYAGMHINIKGRGGDYGRLWCFVNRENKIIATSEAYAHDAEVVAEQNGKCIVCAEVDSNTVMSVEYTPYSLAPVLDIACDNKEEIDALKGALGQQQYEEINYKSVDFEVGAYTPIGTLETVDVTAREKAINWRTLVVSCKAGTTATFTVVGGVDPRAYAIVAPDGTVLNRAEASAQLIDHELYIAEDATLVINSDSVVDYYLTLRIPISQTNILESIERRFETDVLFDADEWQVGYINTSGGIGSVVDFASQQVTNYAHVILDCFTGMQIKITGMGGGEGRLWCFVDGDSIIHSVSGAYENGAELVAPIDGKIIVNAEIRADYPKSVKYTPNSLKPIAEVVAKLMPSFTSFNGALMFAEGASLKYETPEIPASPTLTGAEKLTHYYGLYDALVSAYPDYVSKVDCDAECAAAGITRPDYMTDYPIYMYKFIPAYTSNSNALDGVSDASRYKVYIVSGTHPEMMAIWDLYNTMRLICEQWKNDENLEALRWQCEFYVIPLSGSYCVANGSRTNYNGVDLNRNAPSTDWVQTEIGTNTYSGESAASEYETKVFVHYMDQIQPQVFIDHHNTYAASDLGVLTYITSLKKSCVDVATSHISTMTRRWKKRFSNVLPDNNVIFGYANADNVTTGTRESYGNDCGAWSYTFESQSGIGYDNGVVTEGAHSYDSVASTIATDSFINFLLLALRNTAQRISAGLID